MKRAAIARLPAKLTLPSGAVVRLEAGASDAKEPVERAEGAPLFSEVLAALAAGRVSITRDGKKLDVGALVLRDFHVLRGVLARSGVIAEDEVEIACRNCGAAMHVRPCASLEIGPWVDGELDDPELDVTLPLGEPIDVPPIPLGRVRTARTVTFEERTVAEARPLFAAAAQRRLDVTSEVVRAMGIVALGAERDAEKIATALAECDDPAFFAVGDAFLATHYVVRLGCVVLCEACGARNDVDAPYERESGGGGASEGASGREGESGGESESGSESESEGVFPDFERFAARAREIGEPRMAEMEDVELVVEGGTPAVDDGGEPLLGSYVPPHPGDAGTPTQAPVVTVYYRTFRAMWDEDGPYDWDDELAETIEHELEHHVSFLRGDDPTDDEERAEIRAEAMRIVGKREAGRRALHGFGASWSDFLRRTWPIWVLALLALLFTLATQR
ncbi:MAG: hypothetical protein JWO86_4081 [Myxococcaceae bacterium]|nr:hypothetical protein [Myxococcaceae bacterium]